MSSSKSDISHNIENLPLHELRRQWAEAWGREPHDRIGRTMLVRSLAFKRREQVAGGLPPGLEARLAALVAAYKANPHCFDAHDEGLKPGIRLVRVWKDKRHSVLVVGSGFEYEDRIYSSLSEVATTITGTRWNGWAFFGLRGQKQSSKAGYERHG